MSEKTTWQKIKDNPAITDKWRTYARYLYCTFMLAFAMALLNIIVGRPRDQEEEA